MVKRLIFPGVMLATLLAARFFGGSPTVECMLSLGGFVWILWDESCDRDRQLEELQRKIKHMEALIQSPAN